MRLLGFFFLLTLIHFYCWAHEVESIHGSPDLLINETQSPLLPRQSHYGMPTPDHAILERRMWPWGSTETRRKQMSAPLLGHGSSSSARGTPTESTQTSASSEGKAHSKQEAVDPS